ncbi:MAG: alpha/beta fold hydrolase [Butyricicoccus sp.]
MKIHEFGDRNNPHILLIHGGGSAWWNYLRQAETLAERYHVILPTLDGHGEEYQKRYRSTESSAEQLLGYIDTQCGGHVFCLGGVSLGGQIVLELLSRREDLADKAIIEGSMCIPCPRLAKLCEVTVRLFGGLLFRRSCCKGQIVLLNALFPKLRMPKDIAEYYVEDTASLHKETLCRIYQTYMNYACKDGLKHTRAQILYCYGSKETNAVKRSAELVGNMVPDCRVFEVKGCGHGYLSMYLPEQWLEVAVPFLEQEQRCGI